MMGSRTKLRNEELHNIYSSSNIIRVILSREMRWKGHVIFSGEKGNVCSLFMGKLQVKRQ
jgi:hypothetical protein